MRSVLNNKVIFSYCRVSTSEQTLKNGLDNQKFINNQAIDTLMQNDSFTRLDDVIKVGSAFKGNNLNGILAKAKAGYYPTGSIVVMFDQTRFSRSDFFDAAIKMKEIVESGLNIHFSTTNQTVGSELLSDFGGFVGMIAQAKAANDESRSRSNRTLASYNNKIANNEIVAVGALPNWLKKKYDTSGTKAKIIGFALIPERQQIIKKIFNKYINGLGVTKIVLWLNENIEVWHEFDGRRKDPNNKVWRESYVTKILVNPAIIGDRIFNIGKENESRRADYYPECIDKSLFYQALEVRKNRPKGTTGGYKYPVNIFSGIAYCGYCGSKCNVQNFNNGRKSSMRCTAYSKKEVSKNICPGGNSPSAILERILIEYCSDEINYDSIFKTKLDDVSAMKMKADILNTELESINEKLTKLEDLYFDDVISKERFTIRKTEFDDEVKTKSIELKEIKLVIDKNTHYQTSDNHDFIELVNSVKDNNIPEELRIKIRDLLPRFINKIEVYRYSAGYLTKVKLAELKEFLKDKNDTGGIIDEYEKRTIKSLKFISYGIHFNTGYYRIITYNTKSKVWELSDTKGIFGKKL